MIARTVYLAAVLLATAALAADRVTAQEGGLRGSLTLTPGLQYDDDTLSARLGLAARLQSETRTQRLSLSFDGALDSAETSGQLNGLRDPRLSLAYEIDNRNAAFGADVSYRRSEVDSLFLEGDPDDELLVLDEGQREDIRVGTRLSFGREAPFGGTLDLSYREQRYIDTADPTLLDEKSLSAGLSLRFSIDRRLTTTVTARLSETDVAGSGADQRSESFTLGAELAVNASLLTSASIGGSRVTDTIGGVDVVQSGLTYGFAAVRDLPDGTLSAEVDSSITAAERLTKARVEREIDLPRGALSLGAGLGKIGSDEAQALFSLAWEQETSAATLGLSLDRDLVVNRDGDSAVDSRLRLSWNRELDSLSRLGASLNWRETERLDPGTRDARQASITISWGRDLTRDWAIRSSYTHRWTRETGSADRTEESVFIGLERTFQWRP